MKKDRLYVIRLTTARHIVTVPIKDGYQSLAVEQYPLPRPEDLF